MCSCCRCESGPLVTGLTKDRATIAGRGQGDEQADNLQPTAPWFRTHPGVAITVIAISSIIVTALQIADTQATDAIALLYVLPISLAAVTFGAFGGLSAAGVAYLAFGLFAALSTDDHVGLDGWIGRAAAMFLLGGLLGRACDQSDRASHLALANQRRRLMVEEENRRYGEAVELSDSILQHVTAAKWAIEQGDHTRATGLLAQALNSGQEMVGELLPPRSGWPRVSSGPVFGSGASSHTGAGPAAT